MERIIAKGLEGRQLHLEGDYVYVDEGPSVKLPAQGLRDMGGAMIRQANKMQRKTNAPGPESLQGIKNAMAAKEAADNVDHPEHYTRHPSGVEAIQVTECFNFNLGNAVKYIWRADLKGKKMEDLKKAAWYLAREIARIG